MLTPDSLLAADVDAVWGFDWLTHSPVAVMIGTVLTAVIGLIVLVWRLVRTLAPSLLEHKPDDAFAIAAINRLEPTGMRIDDSQQYRVHMRVYTPDGQDFDTISRQTFCEHELMTISPGNLVPVTVDPADRSRVRFHTEAQLLDAHEVYDRIRTELGLTDARTAEIIARGVRTTGTVTNRRLTGRIRHGHSELLVTVQFICTDGRPVTRTKSAWLLPMWFPSMEIGSQVTVAYLPEDDSQFIAGGTLYTYD